MLAFLWVIWLQLVKRNMLENTFLYVMQKFRCQNVIPQNYLGLLIPMFLKNPFWYFGGLKSLNGNHFLLSYSQKCTTWKKSVITRFYPWSVTDNKSFKGYKTILKSKNTNELSLWHIKMFLGSAFSSFPPSISFHTTQPWIFNIVLSECTCYKELFRNT